MRTLSALLGSGLLAAFLTGAFCSLENVGDFGYEITCSAGLLCKLDETQLLCMPDIKRPTQGPALGPTEMRTKTVLHCTKGENCSPCVRVELDITVLESASLEESGHEDGHRQGAEEEEADDEDSSSEGSLSSAGRSSNDTFIKTLLIFSQTLPSQMCVAAEVCVPLSFLQQNLHKENVGTVVFDCFETVPSAEVHLQSYTRPRHTEKLESEHGIPDCKLLKQMGDVKNCQVPSLQISIQKDVVIGVMNVSKVREYQLRLYYNRGPGEREDVNSFTLSSENNYSISHLDIVPCLCVEAWWKDIQDAVRLSRCPFWNNTEYEENVWRKSSLILDMHGNALSWQWKAPCNVLGQIALCWKSSPNSECHSIPHSRRKILVNVLQEFKPLISHPALCVQAWREGKIWYTQCPRENLSEDTRKDSKDAWKRNNVLVLITQSSVSNLSICILEGGSCISLYDSMNTNLRKAVFLERQLLQDSLSNACETVWSPHGNITNAVLLCSLDKYTRLRLTLAWPICILIALCAFLLLMLQNRIQVKEWLTFIKEDHNSPGFLSSRRVLILHFPDHAAFERLVSIFASALEDLQFKVTVDLWYQSKISAIGPMGWFHNQRLEVLEQNGMIVLLFSKGALETCKQWLLLKKGTQPVLPEEPQTTFAASLNCVIPAFLERAASGHYVIACFEDLFSEKDVPHVFQSVPVFPLPSQLTKFLVAVAGGHKMVKSKDLLKRQSKWINHKLADAIRKCKYNQSLEPQLEGHCSEMFLLEQD